jgi:LAS superfamily LD-carboxypeptidase LdcB
MNGKLGPTQLRAIRPSGKLHPLAADAWDCLRHVARQEGLVLGQVGDYRTYERQVALFTERMRTFPDAKRPTQVKRRWKGQMWYLHSGAPVAVPGASNHGLGLAIDCSLLVVRKGKAENTSITFKPRGASRSGLDFLLGEALSLGWSWELDSEPWHIRYWAGAQRTPRIIQVLGELDK